MSKSQFKCLASIGISLLAVSSAYALVNIQSSFSNGGVALAPTEDVDTGEFSYTFTNTQLSSFTATGSEKLVFGFSSRDGAGNGGALPTSVTYGGVSLQFVGGAQNANRATVGIWYLDNVASDGDLVIDFGTNGSTASMGFSMFALDGLVAGGATTGATVRSNEPTPIILGAGGGFVLGQFAGNNVTQTTTSGYTEDFSYRVGSDGLGSQHLVTQDAGDYTLTSFGGNNTRVATYAWAAIPEPSSFALIGLAGLALLRRRRRA